MVQPLSKPKLHILLVALKVLMLKILIIVIKKQTTFDVGPTICISPTDEGKTQGGLLL